MQSLPVGKPNYRMMYVDMLAYGNSSNTLESMSLTGNPPAAPNQAPLITSLTTNDNYTAGTTSAALNVTANDPEGGRLSYLWTKTSGGTVTINNAGTKNATVTGLSNSNTYVFKVTITDSVGAATTGTKSVTVGTANNAPVSIAGISRQLSLGADSVHLDGEATDNEDLDCCAIHVWSLLSGPNTPTFTPTDWNPVVTNMIPGTYTFKLSITDSGGLTSESTVTYTIPALTNQTPTVQPSPPVVRVRSASTATIGFFSNDPDGPHPTIVISQVSGPTTAGITSATSDTTGLTRLAIGTYIFKGVVTDNKGATAQAQVTVIVNNPPTVDLSGTTTTTLPTGTVTYTQFPAQPIPMER